MDGLSLADQLKARKKTLNEAQTVVTTASGQQHVETRTSAGFQASESSAATTGFILSDQEADPNDPNARVVEVDFHNQLNPTPEEMKARLLWEKERMQIGDGFYASPQKPALRVGVFVISKSPNEQHYDSFAFLLSQNHHVQQIDHTDIINGILVKLDCVIFPGGLIFDVEKALGTDGAKLVNQFVFNGGGYFGVCAGAFLATGEGYSGGDASKKMLAVETGYLQGVGSVQIKFGNVAGDILGKEFANTTQEIFWANGPLFRCLEKSKEKNKLLDKALSQCTVLGEFESVKFKEEGMVKSLTSHPQRAAAISSSFGKGRILVLGSHPEASGISFKPFVLNAIKWCANK